MRRCAIALICIIALSSCAQPPPKRTSHAATYKTELATRLDLAVNYHLEADGGIVVIDMSNPRGYDIRLWLIQVSQTDGQKIIAARRFYSGTKKKHQEIFRVPLPQAGITESFYIEAFKPDGKLLMKSEPIINTPREGKL